MGCRVALGTEHWGKRAEKDSRSEGSNQVRRSQPPGPARRAAGFAARRPTRPIRSRVRSAQPIRRPNHSTHRITTLRFTLTPFPRPTMAALAVQAGNAGTGELAAVGTASAGERRTATPCSCSRLPPLMRQWRCGWSLPQGLHRWVPLLLLPWPSSLVVRGQVKWRAGPPRPVSPMPRSHAVPLCAHAAHR